MLEDQQRLKKVSNSVFTKKIHWGTLSQISGVFLNLNLYSNQHFEFEFAFKFRTSILHTCWSWSQTNDLSTSVRTFFEKRTPFHLPLSPCKRASCHTYFFAIIISADENDWNKYTLCDKAMTTSDSIWENGPLFYYDRYIIYIPPQFCHVRSRDQRKKPFKTHSTRQWQRLHWCWWLCRQWLRCWGRIHHPFRCSR